MCGGCIRNERVSLRPLSVAEVRKSGLTRLETLFQQLGTQGAQSASSIALEAPDPEDHVPAYLVELNQHDIPGIFLGSSPPRLDRQDASSIYPNLLNNEEGFPGLGLSLRRRSCPW